MELTTSTFILEMVNFIILVWILKRFLYAPILNTIKARQDSVKKIMDGAENVRKEAAALNEKYENRLRDWEKEKETSRGTFKKELEEERVREMAGLQASIKTEREKSRAGEERRLSALLEKQELQATTQALKFTTKLLGRMASPELEERLIRAFLDDLKKIPPEKLLEWKTRVNSQVASQSNETLVQTAFSISKDLEEKVTSQLTLILGQTPKFKFELDPSLMAGVRVKAGLLDFHADLRDELSSFSEARFT